MKRNIFQFIFIGILAFWIPLLALIYVFKHLQSALQILAKPIKRLFPNNDFFEIFIDILLFAVLFLLISYLIGIIARKTVLNKWVKRVDHLLGRIFPSYIFDKNFLIGKSEFSENKWEVALIKEEEIHKLGMVVEQHPDGLCIVYIPGAPSASSGEIIFVRKEKLIFLSLSVEDVIKLTRQYGVGLSDLYDKGLLMPKPK